ncbi:hypothetical protein B0T25DRAFT_447650, partial [Lasiosphaeria hispida]
IINIETAILMESWGLLAILVTRKIAWAISKEIMCVKDRAYLLLSLFDINLPLYGEGPKVFFCL